MSQERKPSESPGFPERELERAPAGSGSLLDRVESRGRNLSQTGVPSPPEGRVTVVARGQGVRACA